MICQVDPRRIEKDRCCPRQEEGQEGHERGTSRHGCGEGEGPETYQAPRLRRYLGPDEL